MVSILVIDDSQSNVLLLKKLVATLPECQAVGFTSSLEAVDWCQTNRPDLVLVDYMMPSPDGLEFIEIFRKIKGCKEIPVVMVTTSDVREVRYKALEMGATDFLNKPIDRTEFLARMRNLIKLHESQKRLADRAHWLAQEVRAATKQLVESEREVIFRLSKAAEHRDPETGAHLQRMSNYSRVIGEKMGLGVEDSHYLFTAAPMHDIGKVGTPDNILLKPGRLTPQEFEVMKQHTTIGFDILRNSHSIMLQIAAQIAASHHEKFDGSGYPGGITGENIPLFGRIVAVADVFDALTSERTYKKAWPQEEAEKYLRDNSGKHFDPECVDAFFTGIKEILDIKNHFKDEPIFKGE